MINHNSENPNVALMWSTSHMHHDHWLNLPYDQFWESNYPGALILDVVALRDIKAGEELYLDYGAAWEEAWNKHVESWKPPVEKGYSYPGDLNSSFKKYSQAFRTIEEQKSHPNPSNLATACWTPNWKRDAGPMKWYEPTIEWPEGMASCHILERKEDSKEGFLYKVAVTFDSNISDFPTHLGEDQLNIDVNVPQRAIVWVDKPYTSDLHLKNAFRHPIGFPDHLVPKQWVQSVA